MPRNAIRKNNVIVSRQCVPGGSGVTAILQSHANKGLLVTLDGADSTPDEPKFGRIKVKLTNVATDKIYGVLLDYINDEAVVIGRVGQIWVTWGNLSAPSLPSQVAPRASNPGWGVQATLVPGSGLEIIDTGVNPSTYPWGLVNFNLTKG